LLLLFFFLLLLSCAADQKPKKQKLQHIFHAPTTIFFLCVRDDSPPSQTSEAVDRENEKKGKYLPLIVSFPEETRVLQRCSDAIANRTREAKI